MTVVRRLMLGLVCVLLAWSARAAANDRVITLFALNPRYFARHPAAEERLRAELSAAGFDVKDQPSQARSTPALLEELRRVSSWGSVAMLFENAHGTGYVWLAGQADPQRLTRVEGDAAADILALSVVELVNARALAIAVPAEPRPPDVVVAPRDAPAPRPEVLPVAARRWSVSMDFGPAVSPGLRRWGGSLGAAVLFAASDPVRLELGAHATLVEATADTDAGTASLRVWDIRGHALWRALRTSTVDWDLGAGAGPLFARARSRARLAAPATEDTTTTLVVAARSRLVWWLHPALGVLFVVEPGVIAPPLELFEGTRAVAVVGRPWFSAGLGVVLAI